MEDTSKTPNRSKRKPKTDIKFNITLNEEQKRAKEVILSNAVTLLSGKPGSGKTLVACQVALDKLFKRECEQVIIARPTVEAEDSIGFLKGDIREKLDPYLQPIYENFNRLYGKEKIKKYLDDGSIRILPLGFVRGHTFTDSVVIIDEAQNVSKRLMEAIITRIGKGSTMIICGDSSQIDLKNKQDSGFGQIHEAVGTVKGLGAFELKTNHRHDIVEEILKFYKNING